MAARTGVGVGMGVTVAVLGVATLTLFVLTFVFYGQKQNAERALAEKGDTYKDYVRPTEMNDDAIRQLVDEARKAQPPQSALGYVRGSFKDIATKTTGLASETPKSLSSKIDAALANGGGGSLLGAIADRDSRIAQLTRENRDAKAAADSARAELENAINRAKAAQDALATTLRETTEELERYKANAQANNQDVQKLRTDIGGTVDKIKRDANDEIVRLNENISRLNQELAIARAKIETLTSSRRTQALRPGDEAALVDGLVVGQGAGPNEVVINRGRKDHVVLGMTFEVYGDASAIRVDADGNYPRGKASVEVIRVDENSSTARVIRAVRGQPVVNNDVIASAIYDPRKVYTFLVYGNFENSEGIATPAGGQDIKALVEQWGGKVTDSLTGDVDFVVLGQRPVMPPNPPADASAAVIQEFLRQRRFVQEYDRLLQQAAATQIPVLNQNRLMTLIGR